MQIKIALCKFITNLIDWPKLKKELKENTLITITFDKSKFMIKPF